MVKVGIRELKQRASEILRSVREDGQEVAITYHGRVVARLVPVLPARAIGRGREEKVWVALDELAQEIGEHWPEGVGAVEAIAEGRR